jgi:aurora kinase
MSYGMFSWALTDFDFQRNLGQGRFGKVYLAQEKKSTQKAIVDLKISEKRQLCLDGLTKQFKSEVDLQRGLK